jgi:Fe2+ transport system protein B
MEGDNWITGQVLESAVLEEKELRAAMNKIESLLHESPDILIADHRYGFISGLAREIVTRKADRKRISSIIDRFVLNRILGIPYFSPSCTALLGDHIRRRSLHRLLRHSLRSAFRRRIRPTPGTHGIS